MRLPDLHPLSLLQTLAIGYALLCLFMWGFQRQLIYFPQTDIQSPERHGLSGFSDLRLQSLDGTGLQVWHHAARSGYPTVLYFHGNAGHLGGRAAYFRLLSDAGFGVLALSYRGYGQSGGRPSEQGFYQDAQAIQRYARERLMLPTEKMILYGESIGAGVAAHLAIECACAALVLQAPFTSLTDIAKAHYPWLPVNLLLSDHFDSFSKIAHIQVPLLLLHGEKDTIVPVKYGKALFERAPQPKQAIYQPHTGHNNFDLKQLTDFLYSFSKKYNLIEG